MPIAVKGAIDPTGACLMHDPINLTPYSNSGAEDTNYLIIYRQSYS
jgi:hypothetical protein